MVFCGQCGLRLAPESTTCPRCGSVTEPDLPAKTAKTAEDPHIYDPTIVSTSFPAPHTPQPTASEAQRPPLPSTPPQQPKLILRPDGNVPPYSASGPYDPTSRMSVQQPVSSPNPGEYAGYVGYPGYSPHSDAGYQSLPGQLGGGEPLPPRHKGRGRIAALLTILIILLLLLGAIAVVALKPDLLQGFIGGPTPTPVTTPIVPTPASYARVVMKEYYRDINVRNYQGAYNLWGNDYQQNHSLSGFTAGYAHTRHDDLTINTLTPLADGTVSVVITIKATEDTATGPVLSTYQGTYIVGQENGVWKILSGNFHRV